MPHSARENDAYVQRFVMDENIKTVLDVGAGSGTYANILGGLCTLDAIEVWEPYVHEYQLGRKYRSVFQTDVRLVGPTPTWAWDTYDLIVFGDVLEHMTRDEALAVWEWASKVADWGLISVPIVHWPQGAAHGNPYEEHVQEKMDLSGFGPFDYEQAWHQTGTFIKDFR